MKLFVALVCSLATLASGSLEPAGYEPPGTYPQTSYLPPSSSNHHRTANRYIAGSFDDSRQNFDTFANVLSRSLSLPLQSEPAVPFSNYLPANQETSDHQHDYQTLNVEQRTNVLPRYNPNGEIQRTLTQFLPGNGYLSPSEKPSKLREHDFSVIYDSVPESSFSPINNGRSAHFSSSFSGQKDFSSSKKQWGAASIYRQGRTDDIGSDRRINVYGNHQRQSGNAGHRYPSSENQIPAKYDFEYEVKDNYGNDYGHRETRNGENTQGVYKVLLPDGRRQIVHYEADSHGYRPMITYEEADASFDTRKSTKYGNQGYRY